MAAAPRGRSHPNSNAVGVIVGLILGCAIFVILDQGYLRLVGPRLPSADSSWSATFYGLASRLHLVLPLVALAAWRPRLLGLQLGQTRQHLRWLAVVLLINCGTVGSYLVLTSSSTPFSGNEWLITEVVTVPAVEELMWRGVAFAVLLAAFRRAFSARRASTLAVWCSGLAFGLLHAANVLVGVPTLFVVIQVVNACIWGLVYGYARARTGSIYPPLVLHAAMNLTVVLL